MTSFKGTDVVMEPADYCSANEELIIHPGEEGIQICRAINIIDDNLCEGNETFSVRVDSVSSGAVVSGSPVIVTIQDDDGA